MKKIYLISLFLFLMANAFAQPIEEIIGMSADRFIALSKLNRQFVDVNYYNGEVIDMATCQDNMLVMELRKRFNVCKIYMVFNGKIKSVATRFENASIVEIEELYSIRCNKIGDFYFEDDYQFYYKVFLPSDGYPTAEYKKTDFSDMPKQIKLDMQQKQNKLESDEKERKRIELNKEKLREAEEKKMLASFLKERKLEFYLLSQHNEKLYEKIKQEIENKIIAEINPKEKLSFEINVKLFRHYDDITKWEIDCIGSITSELKQQINNLFETIDLPLIVDDKYQLQVNTEAKFYIKCNTSQKICRVSNLDSGYVIEGDPTSGKQIILDINKEKYALGKYNTHYNTVNVNDLSKSSIEYNSFKGLGGPSNAFLSLFVPGLGRHFVNDTKKYPWLVTLSSLCAIGGGVYLKIESNKNYDLYHASNNNTPQEIMDEYYKQANSQHKQTIAFIGIGAAIWIYDIIWTFNKGAKNKRENLRMKERLSFHPVLYEQNKVGFGLTYNF